ncbi:hypothetical protein LF887_15670 [Chryseobacterium sp. MEBOG06]|uniref:hypothetical protein n=1 Tax=Chryseobacterium sp. MEBOG06 TaxID=2879938 RepID=UPI001F440EB2|nr:hypothetical protein [Chryseobacterium sp. MEBOG06]UKB82441.1 hypothetical protein LF887_15670 [Chryseobacterium sp. MEBOG06]
MDNVINNLQEKTESIYELDKLYRLSYARQKIKEGSIYNSIIQTKRDQLSGKKALLAIAKGIFAAALIAATWGAATPVVIAGGALSLAMSIDIAYETINEYKNNKEFHDLGLLSDDPSLAWVVIAIAGVALDSGALISVLKAAKPIAKAATAFNKAKNTTKALDTLENDLFKIKGLKRKVQQNILKQAEIEAKLKLALHTTRIEIATANMGVNFNALPQLTKVAYYAIKKGAINFENFVLQLKAMKIIDNFDHLSAEEKLILKQAFEDGNKLKVTEELGKLNKYLPKDCEITLDKTTYIFNDLSTKEQIGFVIIKDRYLEFAIYRKGLATKIRGKDVFNSLIEHLKLNKIDFDGIKGLWVANSDNLIDFNKVVKNGLFLREAAFETWTGKRALEHGFTKALVTEIKPSNPPYTAITVKFFK